MYDNIIQFFTFMQKIVIPGFAIIFIITIIIHITKNERNKALISFILFVLLIGVYIFCEYQKNKYIRKNDNQIPYVFSSNKKLEILEVEKGKIILNKEKFKDQLNKDLYFVTIVYANKTVRVEVTDKFYSRYQIGDTVK